MSTIIAGAIPALLLFGGPVSAAILLSRLMGTEKS